MGDTVFLLLLFPHLSFLFARYDSLFRVLLPSAERFNRDLDLAQNGWGDGHENGEGRPVFCWACGVACLVEEEEEEEEEVEEKVRFLNVIHKGNLG